MALQAIQKIVGGMTVARGVKDRERATGIGVSSGSIYIHDGSTTRTLQKTVDLNANQLYGVESVSGAALKIARGQATTVTASDSIVSGLSTILAVVVTLDSDPVDGCAWASAVVPASGGTFLLNTWMFTNAANDVTPTAATTFSKKVNWIAFGY